MLPTTAKAILEACIVEKPILCLRKIRKRTERNCLKKCGYDTEPRKPLWPGVPDDPDVDPYDAFQYPGFYGGLGAGDGACLRTCMIPYNEAEAALSAVKRRRITASDPVKSLHPQVVATAVDTLFDGFAGSRGRRRRRR